MPGQRQKIIRGLQFYKTERKYIKIFIILESDEY